MELVGWDIVMNGSDEIVGTGLFELWRFFACFETFWTRARPYIHIYTYTHTCIHKYKHKVACGHGTHYLQMGHTPSFTASLFVGYR